MNDERLQILSMVQEGKISPEDAARLLDALEQPRQAPIAGGPRPAHIRVQVNDGGKTMKFSVGVKMATWILSLPWVLEFGSGQPNLNKEMLTEAITNGRVGKVFEATEGRQHIEIWLDD